MHKVQRRKENSLKKKIKCEYQLNRKKYIALNKHTIHISGRKHKNSEESKLEENLYRMFKCTSISDLSDQRKPPADSTTSTTL